MKEETSGEANSLRIIVNLAFSNIHETIYLIELTNYGGILSLYIAMNLLFIIHIFDTFGSVSYFTSFSKD